MNFIPKPEHDFQIEAKRVNIANDIENLTNNMLSDMNFDFTKIYNREIPWRDNCFWSELPNPKNNSNHQKSSDNLQPHGPAKSLPSYLKISKSKIRTEMRDTLLEHKEKVLLRKFFCIWMNYFKNKKNHTEQLTAQLEQREKLNGFLKSLKQYQNQKRHNYKTAVQLQCTFQNLSNATTTDINGTIKATNKSPQCSYKHRFNAQKEIIQSQKDKLVKQEKIIQELKLGKLHEQIIQSFQETQKDIQETLTKCSVKVKCKIRPTGIAAVQEDSLQFYIQSTKAPKILQTMEKRALERECRRQIILERKMVLDQMKKQAAQMEIDRKRVQDEQERKRNLEAIKASRMKEFEMQQRMQIKRQQYLEICLKADRFYTRKLSKYVFRGFATLLLIKNSNMDKSQLHYDNNLKQKGFNSWIAFLTEINIIKYSKVEQLYNIKLKRKILQLWFNIRILNIQHLQVAEDLYEMKLQSRTFIGWHRYTCRQYIQQNRNLQKAQRHHNCRILLHYFYLWKSLPVVVQLEQAKEAKKRKWREKVWEILPDYKPIMEE